MANLFDLLKSGVNALNPLSWIGDAIGGVTSLIGSDMANKSAEKLTAQQIAAQKQMNERNVSAQLQANQRNIASQEKINQQQLDFAQGINDIMRKDSLNAISNKKADLQRAGYSAADPSLQGFSVPALSQPSLSAPQVQAPQVESEFTPAMASTLISSRNSTIDNLAKITSTLSSIALQRAQSDKTKAETSGILESNEWISLIKNAEYSNLIEDWQLKLDQGSINKLTMKKLANDLLLFDTQEKLLKEQLTTAITNNKYLGQKLVYDLQEQLARISNIKTDTSVKSVQKEVLEIKKDFDEIVKNYASIGINFNSGSLFDSVTKLLTTGNADAIDAAKQTLVSIFGEIGENLFEVASGAVAGGAISGVISRFTGSKGKVKPSIPKNYRKFPKK